MTAYDVRARATAGRLLNGIAKGGKAQALTLTSRTAGTYSPSTGAAAVSSTDQTGSGVVFEYSSFIRSGARNEPGSLIRAGDKQLLLSPLNSAGSPITAPQIDDRITLADGTVFTITAIAPLSPAGTVIYYECNIRGAG